MNKPAGPTSHDVVAMVRRAFGTRRVGHAGTLDPFATGLLIVLVGRATRLARYLVPLPKTYEGVLRLGATTTTDDATGAVTASSDAWQSLSDAAVAAAMAALTGELDQVPPAYSAKRLGGERAHRLARRGVPVSLAPQRVAVRTFAMISRAGSDLQFRAAVGSGTYLRALARDLGIALACGAHLVTLHRASVGPFTAADAVPLESVRAGHAMLQPALAAVAHLASAPIDATAETSLARGQSIEAALPGDPVALVRDGRLAAVARREADRWHPEVVFLP